MRIIAGQLRGRKLTPIKGRDIRPTADRIREALFNILAHKPQGRVVLDLYCGTGALGLEALSRGARFAVFVDNDAGSLSVANQNIARCQVDTRTRVIRWDIRKNLHCLQAQEWTFDLVFIDPPYRLAAIADTLNHLIQARVLNSGALVVAEHSPAEIVDSAETGLEVVDRRRYGRTALTILAAS